MNNPDIELMAHLFRRAGFGSNRGILEEYCGKGYEETVDELLNPADQPAFDDDLIWRYIPFFRMGTGAPGYQSYWMYRMISTKRQLEEKMTLFWHHVFATSYSKLNRNPQILKHLTMLRDNSLGNFRDILLEVSRDPAMIFWLDNCDNHKGAPNENFGRELLELFSMGVGKDEEFNYSEEDVKSAAKAFSGWTMAPQLPRYPYGDYNWEFEFRPDDHDNDEKLFLGEKGNFNGEDIIDIIVKQPATARFVARHLYNFFVADEPQVPAWQSTPPQDMEAIEMLEKEYYDSGYNIKSMMKLLLNSNFFKNSRFQRIKCPAEFVAGVMRLVEDYMEPKPDVHEIAYACAYMGQDLLNPPTVEGWHTGKEWIDSGSLVERINFASDQISDLNKPGVKKIIARLSEQAGATNNEELINQTLELIGPLTVEKSRKNELMRYLHEFDKNNPERDTVFEQKIIGLLQLAVASREFQFA
ncbi:MAG TPA: hypothetical protein DEZ08_06365 [Dehalococcoidia bacterium]|jgi:uncharacterized protein (DUF1800 family)|nr:hypothetical protein [Dehalococcoidia bacterium]